MPGRPGGEVDRDLLVPESGLQDAGNARQQPVDHPLLLVLDVTHVRQLTPYLLVWAVAGELVLEHDRLDLDAVHRDDAAAGVRVDRFRVDRFDVQLSPAADLLVQRQTLVVQGIEHGLSSRGRIFTALPLRPPRKPDKQTFVV